MREITKAAARAFESLEARRLMATFYVDATTGNDSFNGSSETFVNGNNGPVKTIQRAINLANGNNGTSQGDTIQIAAGVYREQPNLTIQTSGSASNRTVITAKPLGGGTYAAVWVLGSDIITNTWTRDGATARYYISNPTFGTATSQVFVDWSPTNDGAPLKQIGANGDTQRVIYGSGIADMTPGTFFSDTANNRLYVWLADGSNPNTRQMSYAKRARAIYQPGTPTANGFTYASFLDLKGLKLRHNNAYDNSGQDTNCGMYTANDQRLIDMDIQWMTGTGVILRGSSQMINCVASNNGGNGVAGQGEGFVIRGGKYNSNFWRLYTTGSAAGIKVITNYPAIYGDIIGIEAGNNIGHGIWYDTCYQNSATQLVLNNYTYDNTGSGIFLEASRNFIVANNVIVGNGDSGIQLNAVENAKIYNNTLVGNFGRATIELDAGTRDQGTIQFPGTNTVTGMVNNTVRNNILYNNSTVYDLNIPTGVTGTYVYNNTSDYNLIYRRGESLSFSSGGTYAFWASTPSTLADWRSASGQDLNSIVADPLFLAGGTGASAYRLGSNSPARDLGTNLSPNVTSDYLGTARPQGAAFDIGAFEYASGGTGTAGPVVVNSDPTVWVDDQLPLNASMTQPDATGNTGANRFWYWTNSPTFSGVLALDSGNIAGAHRQYFTNANPRTLGSNDTLFAYVYLDPSAPTQQVELEFQDSTGSWEHRAYWGANKTGYGVDGSVSARYIGTLPTPGQWVRLEVPAASLGLAGLSITGFSFTLFDGRGLLDKVGNVPGSTPFAALPTVAATGSTRIEAENFDNGGPNIAYFDTTAGNTPGAYRSTDVDIATTLDTGGGFAVTTTAGTEYLKYSLHFAATSKYTLTSRLASASAGNSVRYYLDEVDITGSIPVPNTGGADTFTNVTTPDLYITAGFHTLRLAFVTGNVSVNHLSLSNPYLDGIPFQNRPIPNIVNTTDNRIEAENYNDGANGQAYFDSSGGNAGGSYRTGDGDIYFHGVADNGNNYRIGNIESGDWYKYTVNVLNADNYYITTRAGSPANSRSFRYFVDGVDVTGPLVFSSTGTWTTFTDVVSPGFPLSAGQHVIRLLADNNNFDIGSFVLSRGVIPNAPDNLTATATGVSTIQLTWADNSSDEQGFSIERSTDGITFAPLATLAAGTSAYTDSAATPASTFYYRVTARGSGGISAYTNIASARSGLATVTGSVFADSNSNGVQDSGEAGVSGRTVFIDANSNGSLDSGETSVSTDSSGSYAFSSLNPGTYIIDVVVPSGGTLTTPVAGFISTSVTYGSNLVLGKFGVIQATAAPTSLTLAAASDTGIAGDRVTRLNNSAPASTLTFNVLGTIGGATVYLFAGATQVGSATASGPITVITTNGTTTLPDGATGFYAVQVEAGKGQSAASAVANIRIDTTAPTLSLVGVPVGTTGSAVASLGLSFSEATYGLTSNTTTLTRDGGTNVLTASQSPTTSNQSLWTLPNLSGLTSNAGSYALNVSATGITDAAGNPLPAGTSANWTKNTLTGTSSTDNFTVTFTSATTASISASGNPAYNVNLTPLINLTVDGAGGADTLAITGATPLLPLRLSGTIALTDVPSTATLTVTGTGTVVTATSFKLDSLSVEPNATARSTGGTGTASVLSSLTLATASTFDLATADLVLKNGAAGLTGIQGLITDGRLKTTTTTPLYTTLSAFPNDAGDGSTPYFSTYDGVTNLAVSDVIVKFTYVGDTDLDGQLTGRDFARVLEGYSTGQSGWAYGDVDNSGGAVTLADWSAFNTAYTYYQSHSQPNLGNGAGGSEPGGGTSGRGGGGAGAPLPRPGVPAAPKLVIISTALTNITAGRTLGRVQVEVRDPSGQLATRENSRVTVMLQSSDAASTPGKLFGTTTVRIRDGKATFSNLSIRQAGTYSLKFTGADELPAVSSTFSITPDKASKLIFSSVPTTPVANSSYRIVASVVDRYDNLVTDHAAEVSLVLAATGARTASTPRTVVVTGGAAIFSDVLFPVAGTYGLSLRADRLSSKYVQVAVR